MHQGRAVERLRALLAGAAGAAGTPGAAGGDDPRGRGGDPGRTWVSSIKGLAVLLVLALGVAGWWWWSGRPRAVIPAPTVLAVGVPVPSAAAGSTPIVAGSAAGVSEVVVHVVGLVRNPGLVRLAPGARVADAIAAAGGITDPAAEASVNLARILLDGEQVAVGITPPNSSGSSSTTSLSSATAEQLDALPGIGPVLAARIVQWRTAHGPFRSVDALAEVPGIGPAVLANIRDAVTP